MKHHLCQTCGGALINENGAWSCKYCGNVYEDESVKKTEEMLRSLLDEYKTEQVANLRRVLYDSINAKYIDSEEICRLCVEIKKLLPDDFMANFYYVANNGTPKEICAAIRSINANEHSVYIGDIVRHVARSLRSEYTLPLQNLVERRFKNTDMTKYEELSTLISEEANKVSAGIYETSVPRDVFVAYSSKDMNKVEELVEELEENGLDCFVAVRNLRHGRGAVQNYEKALHEAMDNCRCVVFVSSQNSRTMECDALKVELKYIKTQDILNAPAEYRNNYAAMPSQYKKHRIEYRLDNERSQPIAQRILTEFFSGLEYAYSPEEIVLRIYDFDDELAMAEQRKKEEAAKAEAERKAKEEAEKAAAKKEAEERDAALSAKFEAMVAEMKATTSVAPAINTEPLLKRARMALEDGEFDHADDFCEQILNQDPECADAYMCKLLAELKVSKKELLKEQKELFDNSNNYKKVVRFGSPETKAFLSSCIAQINNRLERERRAREAEEKRLAEEKRRAEEKRIAEEKRRAEEERKAEERRRAEENRLAEERRKKEGTFSFEEVNGGYSIKIKDKNICPAELVIPESYNGKKVTDIGKFAFSGCKNLTSINIPNSVTSIGNWAFESCESLTNISVSENNNSYKAVDGILYSKDGKTLICYPMGKNHSSFVIPTNVTSIGECAFYKCSNLSRINIPDSVTSIGNLAFSGCKNLTSITIPNSVTSINLRAFASCSSLTSINIPNSVTSIDALAFEYCENLTNITIPNSVTSIEKGTFYGCSNLSSITIPDSVTSIREVVFRYCKSLTSITIPNSVTSIGELAFAGCSSLKTITFDGTKEQWNAIKKGFVWIDNPDTITIKFAAEETSKANASGSLDELRKANDAIRANTSASLDELRKANDAIRANTSANLEELRKVNEALMTNVSVNAEEKRLAEEKRKEEERLTLNAKKSEKFLSFTEVNAGYSVKIKDIKNCPASIVIPESYNGKKVTIIGDYAFIHCSRISSIHIPSSVTSIGKNAFEYCSELSRVNIPDGVTSIGVSTFRFCESLYRINIPDSVTSIGADAFSACYNLESINIPDGVTRIESSAFQSCRKLTSINIPNSVTRIAQYTFHGCSKLASINIPNSVTYIGTWAFKDCSNLQSITFSGTKKEWKMIKKEKDWHKDCHSFKVYCTDGTIPALFA